MKKNNLNNFIQIIPVVIMLAMLLAFSVFFLVLPKKDFSENENRMLANCPKPAVKTVSDGSFQSGFENYLSDHFPLRDELLSLSVRVKRVEGKREINDVLYTKDPDGKIRLIDTYSEPQNANLFADTVLKFSDKLDYAHVTVMIAPTAVTVYENELPPLYQKLEVPKQESTISLLEEKIGASMVTGLSKALATKREEGTQVYYRTDHHWSMRGAYCGYLCLMPYLGLSDDSNLLNINFESLPSEIVSEEFYGTTWSKVCDNAVVPDTIEIYENPAWQQNLTVTYEDTGEVTNTPYNRDYLAKKDKYSMFLNNQHSLVTIQNTGADLSRTDDRERKMLVVVKDSYANSLIPFLIDRYETIAVFDPRYYKGSISEWVNNHPEAEDVLILYNLETMDSDRGIKAIY